MPDVVVYAGITSLGYDHMELLGDTLDLIAREKAGIMRKGVPCFTVQQPPEAMAALEVGVQLGQPTNHSNCAAQPPVTEGPSRRC